MLIRLAKGKMKGSKTSRCHMPRKLKYKRMLIGKRKKKQNREINSIPSQTYPGPWIQKTSLQPCHSSANTDFYAVPNKKHARRPFQWDGVFQQSDPLVSSSGKRMYFLFTFLFYPICLARKFVADKLNSITNFVSIRMQPDCTSHTHSSRVLCCTRNPPK